MKRFMKICLALTMAVSILGIGCIIAAFSMGARIPGISAQIGRIAAGTSGIQEYQFDRQNIQKIDLEAGSGTVRIVQGEGDKIIVRSSRSWMKAQKNGDGELKIQRKRLGFRFFGIGMGGETTLTIPKDMSLKEVSLDCGSGEISAEKLSAGEVSIDCGSGDIDLDGVETKKLEIDTGSGDVAVRLAGELQNYDYEIDCGSGDVNLGGTHFDSTEYKLKEHREKSIEIDTGSGDVTIEFIGKKGKGEETL